RKSRGLGAEAHEAPGQRVLEIRDPYQKPVHCRRERHVLEQQKQTNQQGGGRLLPAERIMSRTLVQHRKQFHDRNLLYLFSFDVDVNMNREELGFVPGGVRSNVFGRKGLSRAYHIARDRTISGLGFDAIDGTLSWGGDWIYWREDDLEISQVHASIHTSEGAEIHMFYDVIASLGPGGF